MRHPKRARLALTSLTALTFLIIVMPTSALGAPSTSGFVVGPNVQVFNDPQTQAETAIAINPMNDRNIVIASIDARLTPPSCPLPALPTSKCASVWVDVYTSTDGGTSWSTHLIPGFPGGPTGALSSFLRGSDPIVGFDRHGHAFAGGIFWNSNHFLIGAGESAIALARSDDGGITWNQPVIVAQGNANGDFQDHPQMAVDTSGGPHDGNVYVAWTKLTGLGHFDITVAMSSDRGATWSSVTLSGPKPPGDAATNFQSVDVAVAPDGQVYAVWAEYFQGPGGVPRDRFWLAASSDGGMSFGAPQVVESDIGDVAPSNGLFFHTYPVLAVDTSPGIHRGRLYLVWPDQRSGNPDILLKSSDDGGTTWTSVLRVNTDAGTAAQFNPWVSVAPNGRVDVSFYDRRDDPNDVLFNEYYAGSTDGGASFVNMRVSDVSSDPVVFFFVGDYNQIASATTAAIPAWVDARNGLPGNGNMDVYTASVFAP